MIGGLDIHIPVPSGPVALDYVVRCAWRRWPQCVFVADDDPTILSRYNQLTFRATSEILIYRDLAACAAWRKLGYDDSLKGTSLYLLSDPTHLTVVVETDPAADTQSFIADIRQGLLSAFPPPIALLEAA